MLNNLGTNTWNLLAAAYHGGVAFGMKDMMDEYLDLGYGYICTCTYDAAGLASMLGASEESNAIFNSCSESGSNAKVKNEQKK